MAISVWQAITNPELRAERRAEILADPNSIPSRQLRLDQDPEAQAAFDQFRARTGSLFSTEGRAAFRAASIRLRAATDRLGVTPLPEDYVIDVGERRIEKQSGTNWILVGALIGAAVAAPFVIGAIVGAGGAAGGAAAAGGATSSGVLASSSIPLVSQVGHLAVPAAIASQGASAAVYGSLAAAGASSAAGVVSTIATKPATVSSALPAASSGGSVASQLPGLIRQATAPILGALTGGRSMVNTAGETFTLDPATGQYYRDHQLDTQTLIFLGLGAVLLILLITRDR